MPCAGKDTREMFGGPSPSVSPSVQAAHAAEAISGSSRSVKGPVLMTSEDVVLGNYNE